MSLDLIFCEGTLKYSRLRESGHSIIPIHICVYVTDAENAASMRQNGANSIKTFLKTVTPI